MKHLKKLIGTTTLAVIFSSSVAVHAADPYMDYGSETGTVSVQPYSESNDIWKSIINTGIANWNNSSANVSISVSSSSSNTISAASYDDSWYGLTTQTYYTSTGYTISFVIQINSRKIFNDATNFSNFATSTVTHEFGHVFWLCDNPNTTMSSIMKHSRDRNTMTTPQQFDINNVNAKY